MFAYCNNNSVCLSDPSGFVPLGQFACTYFSGAGFSSSDPVKVVDLTEKLTEYMDENVDNFKKYIKKNGEAAAYLYFLKNVIDKGPLDIKLQDDWLFEEGTLYLFNRRVLRYDDPGNINFGYVGAVLFPEEMLCFGAGLNQISKYGFSFGDTTSYFDDPRDQIMIRYGYSLYYGGGH